MMVALDKVVATKANRAAQVLAALAGVVLIAAFFAVPEISGGADFFAVIAWMPQLGIDLAFRLDGLSVLFAILISGIGVFIFLYSGSYLAGHPHLGRLLLYLALFMVSMLGLVLSDDLVSLFVFWELTTLTSYLLVGFQNEQEKARKAALQAVLVTGSGGLALLAGLLLLGSEAGTFRLSEILAQRELIQASPLFPAILALVLIGAFTKSAQFPFHFWLPNAMAAPTPVSAYLHSATMVKAGVYLMARLHPALGGNDAWFLTLTSVGAITAVWASIVALRQTDLKTMLAWTTVMALGTLTMFLGAEAPAAIAAAMTFLLVHALYKCALFLVVGLVDHGTGTREIDKLGGLAKAMPITAIAACAAAFSMAGFPPFLGFIGKELKYEGALALAEQPWLIVGAAVLANAMMVALALLIAIRVFLRPWGNPQPLTAHEGPVAMWIGPVIMGVGGLLFGLVPGLVGPTLIGPAIQSVLPGVPPLKLALWHGLNLPLLLSVITVALGLAIYFGLNRLRPALARGEDALPMTGERGYSALLDGLKVLAFWQTDKLQGGGMSRAMSLVFVVVALAVAAPLILGGVVWDFANGGEATPLAIGAILLTAAGSIALLWAGTSIFAVAVLGVAGAGVALIFLLHGAVDVATTQLLVEALFVVIIAVVLGRLPRGHVPQPGWSKNLIAIAVGATMSAVLLATLAQPFDPNISRFFEAQSYLQAYGRNVVNVILVDFRALDTLGEITVIAIASIAVLSLARPRAEGEHAVHSIILNGLSRVVAGLMLVFSIFLLWRGHNLPGGGFLGGLAASGGFILLMIAHGTQALRRLIRIEPRAVASWGLAISIIAGLIGLLAGESFLTGRWLFIGADETSKGLALGTPLLFDLGVYLVVIGSILSIALALEERKAKP